MKGHLKVTEIYDDHERVVLDDDNMITAGFVIDIVSVLTGEALDIPNIKQAYFQIGASAMTLPTTDASDIFYHLSAPLSTTLQYGEGTCLELDKLNRSFLASSDNVTVSPAVYQEMLFLSAPVSSITPSAELTKQIFVPIGEENITKNYLGSVEVRIELDKNTANGILLREFGLYAKNPNSYKKDKPLLIAYKSLHPTKPLTKSDQFKLLIEWSVGVLSINSYDTITPGFK